MPDREQFVPDSPLQEQIDDLRKGTVLKYQSDWILIESTGNHVFTHNLGEVPCMVDVIRDDFATGDNQSPVDENVNSAELTGIVKTSTTITVTNNVTLTNPVNGKVDFYYRVRAF